MLLARDDTGVLGSLTLAIFRIPTGLRAWIEDVVVDDEARGKGVGRLLNEVALEHARAAGATTVDLTSRPSRHAANRMYEVYKLTVIPQFQEILLLPQSRRMS